VSIPVYNQNVPTGVVPLNEDYLNLQGNFQQLNIAYGFDHVPLTDTSGLPPTGISGCHTIIHEVTQTNVNTLAGLNQIFSGKPGNLIVNGVTTPNVPFSSVPANNDTQLYSLTGLSSGLEGLSQLTGNSAIINNGFQWLGGTLIQWGKVSIGSGSHVVGNVSFSPNFPRGCFNVGLTLIAKVAPNNSSNNTLSLQNAPPTSTGFSWVYNGGSVEYSNFFWFAIGY
jgi:hypothetical protein